MGDAITLVLAGDVMTGRGVDQILAEPGSPRLRERYVVDARSYVELAEQVNGPIPAPVADAWPWGDTIAVMDEATPAVRVMNLETGVTSSEDFATAKGIHYRMSPANLGCLAVARVDVWALANNHVLDHGAAGLLETLEVLRQGGLHTAGAGCDADAAWSPAVIPCADRRVVVLAVAHASSGVPLSWSAGQDRAGVALLPDLSEATAEMVADATRRTARAGDIRVVSVHWGGNWGYAVPREQRRFAHRLIDAGVHVLHGHSSHHPRPVEMYHDGIVLYGCGDLVNDYEGIGGYERFRDDLRLLWVVRLAGGRGRVQQVRFVPFQARRMRLRRAATEDVAWLARTLERISRPFGTAVRQGDDGALEAAPHA